MKIESIKRPWEKTPTKEKYGEDAYYQTQEWRLTRSGFIASIPFIRLPPINGHQYSNRYCADCWEEGRMNCERIEIDHVQAIKDGGSRTDYHNLRSRCHAHHNGKTHAERKKRYGS